MGDVELTGRFSGVYGALDWVIRLVAINVLWVAGSVAGLVVAGVAPATVAAYWLIREYSLGRKPRLWHDFWRQWRAELGPAQLRLGVPLATVIVFVFYLVAAANQSGAVYRGLTLGIGIVLTLYVATLLYLPAVLVHYNVRPVAAWQITAAAAWRQPLVTVGLVIICAGAITALFFVAPGALLFFAISGPIFLATRAGLRAFDKLT